jgi:hypothetical protein
MKVKELSQIVAAPNAKSPNSEASAIAREFGVEIYHLRHVCWAAEFLQPHGKRILEVGGSLPRALVEEFLQPEQWVALEYVPYYEELKSHLDGEFVALSEIVSPRDLPVYQKVSGAAEDMPVSWNGEFDGIFSVACFEHVNRLPAALMRMYDSLRSSSSGVRTGRLYSGFSPIWSSATGFHWSGVFPDEIDGIDLAQLVGPWGHLVRRPVEMWEWLRPMIGERNASEFVYYTYHSNHINRYFIEDYVAATKLTGFRGDILPYALRVIPEDVRQKLHSLYPGQRGFEADGLLFKLVKP